MTSLLVPVDFTEPTSNAARYAADMAAAMGADLQLIHVWRMPDVTTQGPLSADVLEEIRNSCENSLETLASELIHRTGGKVYVATHFNTGDIETILKTFCQWKKPFLIILGASTVSTPGHLPSPVLVVPPHTTWHPIRKIVLACDQDEIRNGIPGSIDFLQQLGNGLGARFDIIHVCTGKAPKQKDMLNPSGAWKEKIAVDLPNLHVVHAPTVEQGIRQYLNDYITDWLMIFPRKNGLFHLHKSLSKNIVLHCPLPAITAPA